MKRDTIREKERERDRAQKEHLQLFEDELRQLLATFFCASKIAFTHSAKLEEKKNKAIKHKYYQIYTLKDILTMFRQVCWEQSTPVGL